MSNIEEVENALTKSDEELFTQLGSLPMKGAAGSDPTQRGREIYGNIKRKLGGYVCAAPNVKEIHSASGSSEAKIVAAVTDIILAHVAGISAVSVAVLMFREGLGVICADHWKVP